MRVGIFILQFQCVFIFYAQQKHKVDTIFIDSVPKKILYDNKIYKLNAGFATLGTGYFTSNTIHRVMKGLSLNFNFHTFRECYIQIGLNRIKGRETIVYPNKKDLVVSYFNFNFSPFVIKSEGLKFVFILNPIGVTYGGGYKDETFYVNGKITTDSSYTIQNNYFGMNYYSSIQGYYKFKYDLGMGCDVYAEYREQSMIVGIKISFYFSAAFKGNQTKPTWYYKKNPTKN